eukprot:NODE_6521_length_499_cov_151.085586.p2 GENE.NODE_6521_length_499_cov_151.085586~~NODE_6521_length_499_cov_151.085586.p2  ORF type:complete len:134 (+),score=47.35 NODE_6521_length_499_cov_151.085586:3-404(+)
MGRRMRQRLARAEFEKARRHFKAAQRLQARIRGFIQRRRVALWQQRVVGAAVRIQRMFRGHRLRHELWMRAASERAAHLQAAARGFLVRNRRFHLLVKVIMLQRCYRAWLQRVPEVQRRGRIEERRRQLQAET